MIIQDVKDPIYINAEGTAIDCNVKFDEFAEYLPFTATPNDSMDYGRELYAQLVAGDWGPIAPYAPPPPQEYACISPNDKVYDNNFSPPVVLGFRVVAVSTVKTTVPAPLYWVGCPDYVTPNGYYYTGVGFAPMPA